MNSYAVRVWGGTGLILLAVLMLLYNISDSIADLQNWHSATTPAFVGAALKQASSVLLGALGGAALPTGGVTKS